MRKTNAVRHNLPSKPPRKSFSDRSELASLFVRPGDLVCDLGAGAQQLRKFLPANTKYLAVDGVAALPGTHLADFETSDFTLPTEDFNVVMALGLFEHILNLEQFLGRLAKDCEDKFIIFSYDFWRSPKEKFEPAGQERRVRRICNLEDGIAIFSTYIQDLTVATVMRRRVVFTGVLGIGGSEPNTRRAVTQIAYQNSSLAEFLTVKLFKTRIAPTWIA